MRARIALSSYTPAFDLQQACGTGLQAAIAAADGIAAGRYEVAAAGGVDTTSDAPIALGNNLRRTLLGLRRSKSNVERLKLVGKLPASLGVEIPVNSEPRTGLSMGEHAGHHRQADGHQAGRPGRAGRRQPPQHGRRLRPRLLRRSGHPVPGPVPRRQPAARLVSVEKLAKLKPVFGVKAGDATMTAGNSTPLTDGASVALLSTEEWAAEHSLTPLAYFVDAETASVDYVNGADGLLMAPTYAVPRLLARNGLSLQDFDFYEIHEAFASVVLAHLQAWESEEYCKERLGLDAALGSDRPVQAQRQRLVAGRRPPVRRHRRADPRAARQAACREEGGRTEASRCAALISICAAGGQGVAAILEA